MARFALVLMSSLVTLGMAASAQTIQVSRDNKTIYVTSEGEAKAEPEIAILTLGYHAWSKTKDALYDETATVSDKVVAALFRAGVKKEMIRSDKTSLTHVEAEPNWPPIGRQTGFSRPSCAGRLPFLSKMLKALSQSPWGQEQPS